jgi:hypothetical protein
LAPPKTTIIGMEAHLEEPKCVRNPNGARADRRAGLEIGERLIAIEELAERLQYSVEWVREQVNLGRIPVIKFNSRSWRFHWPTVLAAVSK